MSVVEDLFGLGLADGVLVWPRLHLTSRRAKPPARKAGKLPKGSNRFYQLIQTDLLENGGRGGNCSIGDEYVAYALLPEDYGPESRFLPALINLIKRKTRRHPGLARECEQLLQQACPDKTTFEWESSDDDSVVWLHQTEQQRFFLFDRDRSPAGFLELSTILSAASDTPEDNVMEIRIHEAWAAGDAQWELGTIAASYFAGTLAAVQIAWRMEQPLQLDLQITTESEHLCAIGFLEEIAAQSEELFDLEPDTIVIDYEF